MARPDDGGRSTATTNWLAETVESMWQKIANQQAGGYQATMRGWEQIYKLAEEHRDALTRLRNRLADIWPPEKSQAAQAYIDRFNFLIDTLDKTYTSAKANTDAFRSASEALDSARRQMEPIVERYRQQAKAKEAYDAEVSGWKGALLVLPDNWESTFISNPKVTDADLDAVAKDARVVMSRLSSDLIQAKAQFQPPPPYEPGQGTKDNGTDGKGDRSDSDYVGSRPPVYPPTQVVDRDDVPKPPAQNTDTDKDPPVVHPIAPRPEGPSLVGIEPMPPTPPGIHPPPGGGPLPGPTPPPGGPPPVVPPSPGVIRPPGGGLGYPGAPSRGGLPTGPGIGPTPGGARGLPPGGVIGGTPGGTPRPGTPGRPNPVGGVIGGGTGASSGARPGMPTGAGGAVGGRPGATSSRSGQSTGVPVGSRPGQRRDEESDQRWDPDNPWQTSQGVDPVVQPRHEPDQIDPGPAIGLDR